MSDLLSHIEPGRLDADAMLSEKEHPSSSDSKSHFTTVFEDDNGNHISTKHVYPSVQGVRLAKEWEGMEA